MARKKQAAESSEQSLARAIRLCVDSGKVEFGSNAGIKRALSGKAKLVVLAKNCPAILAQDATRFCKLSGIPVLVYDGNSIDLGTVAGKPHSVAMVSIIDEGNSGIMAFCK